MLRFVFVLFVLVAALVVLRRLAPADIHPVLACSDADYRHDLTCTPSVKAEDRIPWPFRPVGENER